MNTDGKTRGACVRCETCGRYYHTTSMMPWRPGESWICLVCHNLARLAAQATSATRR